MMTFQPTLGPSTPLTSLRRFGRLLWHSARWQLVAALALSVVLSLTEGVGLVMVFPLIALLGGGRASAPGLRTRLLFDLLSRAHIPQSAWLGLVLVVVVLSAGLLAQLNGLLSTLTLGIILPLRGRLASEIYRAILHADWTFLTGRRASDLTHFLTTEMARIGTLAGNLIAVVSNGLVGALLLALAASYAPLLTLILLAAFALLLLWQRRASRSIYRSGRDTSLKMAQVFESSMERLGNLKVVKAFGAQDAELHLFGRRYGELVDELMRTEWHTVRSSRQFQLASLILLSAVILLGLNTFHLAAASLLVFLFAFVRATPRLNAVQSKLNEILIDLPAYTRIEIFLRECAAHSESGDGTAAAPELARQLELRDVSFCYSPETPLILDHLNLIIPAGSITAISGLSGAGKSTVADLLMGLLVPDSGTVLVDAEPITRANAHNWRRRIGYVTQDTLLFHDSVRANLLWARPDATDAQLQAALDASSATFVLNLARGLDTVVGDRGMTLSHGERQRLALARALLLQPSLLILDESTNSLDLENEARILALVRSLGVTTVLISHRPSALLHADRVYHLERGTFAPPVNRGSQISSAPASAR